MKLSDYVALFLKSKDVKTVFAITGGASIHFIHSITETPGIDLVCPLHEQAGAMAADGYSRMSGKMGAAIATSGPGATNLLTGICGAYYDSVPVWYITGQVATFRMSGDTGVRQIGFQETDIIDICKSVTNYAVQISNANDIRYELEKAYYLANYGRPGPVLIDIPDNIGREEIDTEKIRGFQPPMSELVPRDFSVDKINECLRLIKNAKRPILILGWGIHLSNAYKEINIFIKKLGFPVAPTWAIAHILPSDHPLYIGTFGTHGTRYANFAVQNSDLVLAIGTRLDTKATGSPITTFARAAKKIVVDIDSKELKKFNKFGLTIDLLIQSDAKLFLHAINKHKIQTDKVSISKWIDQINEWKNKYQICPPEYYKEKGVNPYVFVKTLSSELTANQTIFVDTGCTVAWIMQAFEFKANQRLFHDFNNTAMGWALPASIGACFSTNKKPIIAVIGDGSLMMNIQELATITKHKLPIKIFLLNNRGYSMVKQTQEQWLNSKYYATSVTGGLPDLNFVNISQAFGILTKKVTTNNELKKVIREVLELPGPVFCNVEISPKHRVIPQVKFGKPNEDPEPFLPRDEFFKNMIIEPLE
ncbi:MAG: hypothetical protein A2W17_07620 [Planctomycetes bacterium RBG_16_41_13]|nr:MAG: hypothetical protein A2W17_07620 [Planctomycetes bacterium RBG_16_41_13]